jgi:hypothetical protein
MPRRSGLKMSRYSAPVSTFPQRSFVQPGLKPVNGAQAVIDLTDMGFIFAGMAEENPRHNALSLAGFNAAFSLSC